MLEHGHERLHDSRIELLSCFSLKPLQRLRSTEGDPIGPLGGHRAIGVSDRDETSEQRNIIALNSIWISAAAEAFVMVANRESDLFVSFYSLEYRSPDLRMGLYRHPLVSNKRASFLKDAGWHSNLPNIV